MSTVDLTPGSEEWGRRVSPSKAAAILGISPWDSQRSVWHKMRGDVAWDEETPAMERGNLCEPAVLAWWRKHHQHDDWREQVTLTIGDWCVGTPDALTLVDGVHELVEAKTAANMEDWGDPGTDVIPVYYLTQVYAAMEICHRNGIEVARAHVPVLGGRHLLFSNYVVEYDAAIGADLLDRLQRFHESLSAEVAPPLDDTVATYDAVRKVHKDIDTGVQVVLDVDEAVAFVEAIAAEKASKDAARLQRSIVVDRMGSAQYATCNGERIARRQPDGPERTKFVPVAKDTRFAISVEDVA